MDCWVKQNFNFMATFIAQTKITGRFIDAVAAPLNIEALSAEVIKKIQPHIKLFFKLSWEKFPLFAIMFQQREAQKIAQEPSRTHEVEYGHESDRYSLNRDKGVWISSHCVHTFNCSFTSLAGAHCHQRFDRNHLFGPSLLSCSVSFM